MLYYDELTALNQFYLWQIRCGISTIAQDILTTISLVDTLLVINIYRTFHLKYSLTTIIYHITRMK